MGLFSCLFKSIDSKKITKEGIRIDVRTEEECRTGMIEDAKNIPLDTITNAIGKLIKDKDRLIGVYCRSGMRSAMAKRKLKAMGYMNVVNEGGYANLKRRLEK